MFPRHCVWCSLHRQRFLLEAWPDGSLHAFSSGGQPVTHRPQGVASHVRRHPGGAGSGGNPGSDGSCRQRP
jgi:hypothetical protein